MLSTGIPPITSAGFIRELSVIAQGYSASDGLHNAHFQMLPAILPVAELEKSRGVVGSGRADADLPLEIPGTLKRMKRTSSANEQHQQVNGRPPSSCVPQGAG